MNDRQTALVIGGGVIGCAVAYELAKRGLATTLLDKNELFRESSAAAAGMLGAHVETHHEGPYFGLCKASLGLYRQWAEELLETSGVAPQYTPDGIVRVALTEEDEQELRGRLPWIGDYSWLSAEEVLRLEPAISREVRGGIRFAADHQIHPIHLARSLRAALHKLGCRILEHTPAHRLLFEGSRITGAATGQGEIRADIVVLAAGAWSESLLAGTGLELPSFPVKGQCMAVRPAHPIIRSTVFTRGCYLVPRQDGTITVGATQLEAGFDKNPTTAAISALHATASKLLPSIADARFITTWAGLRPGTPDGLPYLGTASGAAGLLIATGHFRNGILLAPITAQVIGQLACGEAPSIELAPYSPDRVQVQGVTRL